GWWVKRRPLLKGRFSVKSLEPHRPKLRVTNCVLNGNIIEDGMSYRDNQSLVSFAIGAFFVAFGSTSSIALPPEAIPEGVKSCRAIPNDQQRLKCFDDLFATKPTPQPTTADQSAKQENWQIEESKSPTDGSSQIVAANLVGDTVLILRCKDQTTE